MADLTEIQASQAVKIAGSDPTGIETNFAKVSSNQEIATSDVLNNGGVHGAITVGTTAVELKVGASRLANRKYVIFQAMSAGVYFGFSNTVTTSTGQPLFKNQFIMLPIGDATELWFIASTIGNNIRISEVA